MPKITYLEKRFTKKNQALIEKANEIIREYQAQGFTLTLRQLYYQFVARDLIPNNMKSYKSLGGVINNGRLAGLIDWNAIEDRTRQLRERNTWGEPSQIVQACADQFAVNPWLDQEYWPEVWIEKDALIGVIEEVCRDLFVPYFACRGYVSQSEQWRAGQRWLHHRKAGRKVIVFHLGDHDPSGIDMTRDNDERGNMFSANGVEFRRLALNMDQVEQYDPPPNPAKMTDARFEGYVEQFGDSCWELDALEPAVISQLIRTNVEELIDDGPWEASEARSEAGRLRIQEIVDEMEGDE